MKLVYVSHPYGGLPWNASKIASICRQIQAEHKDVIVISPVHCFEWLDDYDVHGRAAGLQGALALLGLCDEMWLYGYWKNSEGCRKEVALALEKGICIKVKDSDADMESAPSTPTEPAFTCAGRGSHCTEKTCAGSMEACGAR